MIDKNKIFIMDLTDTSQQVVDLGDTSQQVRVVTPPRRWKKWLMGAAGLLASGLVVLLAWGIVKATQHQVQPTETSSVAFSTKFVTQTLVSTPSMTTALFASALPASTVTTTSDSLTTSCSIMNSPNKRLYIDSQELGTFLSTFTSEGKTAIASEVCYVFSK